MYEPKEAPGVVGREPAAPTSPTGQPVIPVGAVPWLVGVVGLAGVLAETLPPHTKGAQVAKVVFSIGSALGLASAGWRRK